MKIKGFLRTTVCLLGIYTSMLFPVSAQTTVVYYVGPGAPLPNLTGPGGLFELLNTTPGGLVGNVEVRITGNLCEPGTYFLDGSMLNNFTIKIYPNPGAPLPIIINNCTDINQGLIRLNGVANTTISGLTIINTNSNPANAKPVLEILNLSSNVIIENNLLKSNDPSTTEGTLMLGAAVNTNMIIRNNTITDAVAGGISNYPGNGIYSNNATSVLQITNNTISNNTNYGINLNTGNGTVVDGNRIFESVQKNTGGGGVFITGGGDLTITNNTIGNGNSSGGGVWTQGGGDFYGINAIPNTFTPNPLSNTIISGNTVEGIAFNSPGNPSFSGIFCQQGNVTMNNNTIRNNTINADGYIHGLLVSPVTGSTYNLDLNLVDNLINNNTGSTSRLVGIRNQGGGGTMTITNTTISNLSSSGSNNSVTAPALAGIEIASFGGTNTIIAPILENLRMGNTSATTTLTGINLMAALNAVKLIRAKMKTFYNAGLTGSSIFGITAQSGSGEISNNFIGITNNGFNNDVSVTGINLSGSSSSVYNVYYNSIFLNSVINSGSSSTTCIRRPSSAVVNILNNALVNYCQGGTGAHTAIANTRSSSTATGFNGSNYNFLFTRDPNKIGIWNTTVLNFQNWQITSQKDYQSLVATPPDFNPTDLFDPFTGQFFQNPSSPNSWYLFGNANPISGITSDQRGLPGTRPDNVLNGTPDIGAMELDPLTALPPNMTLSGITAPGATQDCFFGGQKLASITWGAGGTLPLVNWVRRYSMPPPGFNASNPGLRSINSFFDINVTGGSGYTANTTIFWFPNADGMITPISSAVMAKQETGSPWGFVPGSSYATTGSPNLLESVSGNVNQYSRFTAVDPLSSLPVTLLSFKASKKNTDIELCWTTAGEADRDQFELERSFEGSRFNPIAQVTGNGTTTKNYSFIDAGAQLLASPKLYYRLKMVSLSGQSSYSSVIQVPLAGKQNNFSWKAGPNPFTEKFTLSLYLPENSLLEWGLYNTAGSLLRKKTVPGEKGYSTVEMNGLGNLLPGTYYIQLKKNGQVLSKKLLKTRQ